MTREATMARYGNLLCPAKRMKFFLGKVLRHEDLVPFYFWHGDSGQNNSNFNNRELNMALWKFLADTMGHELIVKYDDDMTEEELEYFDIGGEQVGRGVPFSEYLAGWPSGKYATEPRSGSR